MPEANKAVIERKKGYLYVEYSKLYNMDDLVNLSKEALDISKSEGIKKLFLNLFIYSIIYFTIQQCYRFS